MAKVNIVNFSIEPPDMFKDMQQDWELAIKHPHAKVIVVEVDLFGGTSEHLAAIVLYEESGGVATEDEIIEALKVDFNKTSNIKL